MQKTFFGVAALLGTSWGSSVAASSDREFKDVVAALMNMANATIAATPAVDAYPTNGKPGEYGWDNTDYKSWTSGFWPGILWKLHNISSRPGSDGSSDWWLQNGIERTWPIHPEGGDTTTHDVGFIVYPSFGFQWHLTGNRTARDVALSAAASLATRFVPEVGAFRSWGQPNPHRQMQVIADNMMNLELLWWASQESGNTTYAEMAVAHSQKMIADLYQPFNPGCVWHLLVYNDSDGSLLSRSSTPQGLGQDTVWSRGQAWAINGFAMAHRFTKDPAFLEQAQVSADCYIRLTTACCDNDKLHLMPLWDYFVKSPNATIDTSAAVIAAGGMIEMSWHLPAAKRSHYLAFALRTMRSAMKWWSYKAGENDAVLRNGTVTFPLTAIPIIYGDYYLLEAWERWDATPRAWRAEAEALLAAQSAGPDSTAQYFV